MAINYHWQQLPDMRDGESKPYPKLETYSAFGNEKMVERISEFSGMKGGIIKAVISSLPEAMKEVLLQGHTCRIDGLGTFSLSLTTNENGEVEIGRVNLKVEPSFLKALRDEAEFQLVQSEVVTVGNSKGKLEDHLTILNDWLDKHDDILLIEYAQLVQVSNTTASRELKLLCDDPSTGIYAFGHSNRKVWKRRK